jgi:hypothetical protein
MRNERARAALAQDVHAAVAVEGDLEITFHYGGEPVMRPRVARVVRVSLRRAGEPIEADVQLEAPAGWQVERVAAEAAFRLSTPEPEPRSDVAVVVQDGATERRATFRLLGPQEAKGFPAATNLPRCKTCQGLQGYCLCTRT